MGIVDARSAYNRLQSNRQRAVASSFLVRFALRVGGLPWPLAMAFALCLMLFVCCAVAVVGDSYIATPNTSLMLSRVLRSNYPIYNHHRLHGDGSLSLRTRCDEKCRSIVKSRWYAPTSPWNTPISPKSPIAANDPTLIAAWANTASCSEECLRLQYTYTPSIWIAEKLTRLSPVRIDFPNCGARTIQVPIPTDAIPDPSPEGHMAIMQANTGVEYDFFRAQSPGQPSKEGCGTASTWTAAKVVRTDWRSGDGSLPDSVRGSGTPEGAGIVRPRDTQIPYFTTWHHALALSYRNTCSHSMSWCPYVAPATREDGTCTSRSICVPEGARFQLDPSIDCATWPSLRYLWQKQMCRTFQVYGGIIVDTNGRGPTIYDQWDGSLGAYTWPWLKVGVTTSGLPNDLLSHFRVLAW
jgi:hypothetical protein